MIRGRVMDTDWPVNSSRDVGNVLFLNQYNLFRRSMLNSVYRVYERECFGKLTEQ